MQEISVFEPREPVTMIAVRQQRLSVLEEFLSFGIPVRVANLLVFSTRCDQTKPDLGLEKPEDLEVLTPEALMEVDGLGLRGIEKVSKALARHGKMLRGCEKVLKQPIETLELPQKMLRSLRSHGYHRIEDVLPKLVRDLVHQGAVEITNHYRLRDALAEKGLFLRF